MSKCLCAYKTVNSQCPIHGVKCLLAEIEKYRDWIRREGDNNDTCTYHILGEICEGCKCERGNRKI